MPWSPAWQKPVDERLDPYRDRVAALIRDGKTVGHVLILTMHYFSRTGGHPWWRQWADREAAVPHVRMLDGDLDDSPVGDGEVETELDYWSQKKFPWLGELLDMEWLELDQALLDLAFDVFGVVGCLDNDCEIIWSTPGAR